MGHTILYVDDEALNLEAFARAFHGDDLVDRVLTALTPEEALRLLDEHQISAVVSDHRMPGMTGTELLARIVERHPAPVRLILTGYTEVGDVIDAINRGHVFFYITKPWEPGELRAILRRAIEHYEAQEDLRRKNRELSLAYAHLEAAHREQVRSYDLVIADELTGLANYHYFRIRLGEEFERARRYGKDLALLLLDLDDFGALNDRFGREAGDLVIKEVARLLGDRQRSVDVIARYGGEEFALLLPETDLAGARAMAERLRARITGHDFGEATGGRPHVVTASCGISAYPDADLSTKEQLVERADRALCQAKRLGKNRTLADR